MPLPSIPENEFWWLTLVDLVPVDDRGRSFLEEELEGAVGWILVRAANEEEALKRLATDVEVHGLRINEVIELDVATGMEDIEERDEHLVQNVDEWESKYKSRAFGD